MFETLTSVEICKRCFFWGPGMPVGVDSFAGEVSAKEGPLHGRCRGQRFNDPG